MNSPQPTTKRNVDMDGPDFYPTPAWATQALIDNENFIGTVWDPACGDGAMVKAMCAAGIDAYGADLYDRGFGRVGADLYDRGFGRVGVDFLANDMPCQHIVTNPPFNLAEQFVHHGLKVVEYGKVCLLLRLAFLESAGRERTIFSVCPPSRVYVFSERITFYPGGKQTAGSGTVAYAWFVWDKSVHWNGEPMHKGPPTLHWLNGFKT